MDKFIEKQISKAYKIKHLNSPISIKGPIFIVKNFLWKKTLDLDDLIAEF